MMTIMIIMNIKANICPFKKYKHIFGIPGKGVHKYRFIHTAMVDYLLSLLLAAAIAYISHIPLVLTTITVLFAGILCHILFGVQTNTLTYLGITCK